MGWLGMPDASGLGRFGGLFLDSCGLPGSWRLFLRVTWRWRRREAVMRSSRLLRPRSGVASWGGNAGEPCAVPDCPGDNRPSHACSEPSEQKKKKETSEPSPAASVGQGTPAEGAREGSRALSTSETWQIKLAVAHERLACTRWGSTCSFLFGFTLLHPGRAASSGKNPCKEEGGEKKKIPKKKEKKRNKSLVLNPPTAFPSCEVLVSQALATRVSVRPGVPPNPDSHVPLSSPQPPAPASLPWLGERKEGIAAPAARG